MAGGLELKLSSDESDLIRGIDKVDDALVDVVDALTDVTREGERMETGLEGDLRSIRNAADTTSKSVKADLKKAFKEGGQEAGSSGREAAASFSGGFDDVTDFIQETLANAFGGFGPGGAALGVLAAAGLGIGVALFGKAEEDRAALEAKANDLANAYIEAGNTVLNAMALSSRIADVATTDDPKTKDDLRNLTNALGDRALALRVLAGDTEALATAQGILAGKQDTLDDAGFVAASGKRKSALGAEKESVEDLARILGEQSGVQQKATQVARDHSDALMQVIESADSASIQVDEFGNQLVQIPGEVPIVISADTGLATTNVDNFKGDVAAIPPTKTTNVKLSVDATAWENAKARIDAWDPNKTVTIRTTGPVSGSWRIQPLS